MVFFCPSPFTSRYADDWRYCAAWGKWLVWTGARWQSDETLLSHHLIRSICREAALKVDSHRLAAKLLASGTVGGVDRLARSDRRHSSTSEEWDTACQSQSDGQHGSGHCQLYGPERYLAQEFLAHEGTHERCQRCHDDWCQ